MTDWQFITAAASIAMVVGWTAGVKILMFKKAMEVATSG